MEAPRRVKLGRPAIKTGFNQYEGLGAQPCDLELIQYESPGRFSNKSLVGNRFGELFFTVPKIQEIHGLSY